MTARVGWRALLVALYMFLLAPLVVVLLVSFDTRPYIAFPPEGISLGSYGAVLGNPDFLHAFALSMGLGVVVAMVSLVLGFMAALALARGDFAGREPLRALFLSPLLVPHIVLAVGLMMALQPLGLLHTTTGLVLAHIGITLPYTVRITAMGLAGIDPAQEEAARIHGATPWQALLRVVLPAIGPSLLAAGLIAFLVSFDEAILALFLAGGQSVTLPLAIYQYVQFKTDPQIAALSVLMVLLTVVVLVLIERSIGLRRAVAA